MSNDRCDLLCLDRPRTEALRPERLGPGAAEAAAERTRVLGDPTRLTVGHHLRVLRRGGIVSSRRAGNMVLSRLTEQGQNLLGEVLGSTEVPR